MPQIHLKIKNNNDIRRVSIETEGYSLNQLHRLIRTLYKDISLESLSYLQDLQTIPLMNEKDWENAVEFSKTQKNLQILIITEKNLSSSLLEVQDEFVILGKSQNLAESQQEQEEEQKQKNPFEFVGQFFSESLPQFLEENSSQIQQAWGKVTATVEESIENAKPIVEDFIVQNQSQWEQMACTVKDTVEDAFHAATEAHQEYFNPQENAKEVFEGMETLDAEFMEDITIPDGFLMDAGEEFVKTWKIRNNGNTEWPRQTMLSFLGGTVLPLTHHVLLGALQPNEETIVSVRMKAPEKSGRFTSYFRVCAGPMNGYFPFGSRIWCDITVKNTEEIFPFAEQLERLKELGFPEDDCKLVLIANDGDLQSSLETFLQ